MDANPLQQEAIRVVFRQYELEASLTPKLEALVVGLDLIDIKNSSVRCQGQCVNGGRCSQRINQAAVSRSILQLQIVALDSTVVGEELEENLGRVYAALLCGSARHNTPEQTARCAAKAKAVVEVWRVQSERGRVEKQEYDGECTGCIRLFQGLQAAETEVEEVAAERDHAWGEVERVRDRYKRVRQQRDDAEGREEDLAQQLETLQLKHDGLVRKMGSAVEQHQQSSNLGTPSTRNSWRSVLPASISNIMSEAAGRVAERHRLAYESVEAMRRNTQIEEPINRLATSSADSKTRPFSQRRNDSVDALTSDTSKKLEAAARTHAKETSVEKNHFPSSSMAKPTSTSKPDPPFAHWLPTSNNTGMLGIGNTTQAGRRAPNSVLTPEPTPKKKQQAGDVLFKSGPLQFPGGEAQRAAKQATYPRYLKDEQQSKAEYAPGGGYFSRKPWASSEIKTEEKENVPFGFAVRRKE